METVNKRSLRRQREDHNFGSLMMLAVTTGVFLLVTWIATKALMVLLQIGSDLLQPGWQKHGVCPDFVSNDWANVFAPDNRLYDRYGYNISKNRWTYEIEPPQSEKIGKAVVNNITAKQTDRM